MIDAYRRTIDVLSASRRVLVTTHVRPDGDALGTVAATVLGMRKAGISAEVLLLSHLPRKYQFVFDENQIVYHDAEQGWPASLTMSGFDALLVMDTGTWSQLPGLREQVEKWAGKKLVVDHHLTQEDWADVKLVVTEAAAAGEIAAELLDVWQIEFDQPIAAALVSGDCQRHGVVPVLQHAPVHPPAGGPADRARGEHRPDVPAPLPERAGRAGALQTRAQQSLELLPDGGWRSCG